jgi:hypothetical protein
MVLCHTELSQRIVRPKPVIKDRRQVLLCNRVELRKRLLFLPKAGLRQGGLEDIYAKIFVAAPGGEHDSSCTRRLALCITSRRWASCRRYYRWSRGRNLARCCRCTTPALLRSCTRLRRSTSQLLLDPRPTHVGRVPRRMGSSSNSSVRLTASACSPSFASQANDDLG